jgi:hypothetical protein
MLSGQQFIQPFNEFVGVYVKILISVRKKNKKNVGKS